MNEHGPVYLVDDDSSFLTAQSRMLRLAGHEVLSFTSARRFLSEVAPQSRGCVVTDLLMPEMNGLELQRELTNRGVALPVVFLSAYGRIPDSVCAMRAGAVDFIEKRATHGELLEAIQRALQRDAAEQGDRVKLVELRAKFARLTRREREVVQHVLSGRLNKQIAATLGITTRTVKLHRTAIRAKFGIRSAVELATLAYGARLFESIPDSRGH
jgi:FixJ family two-component response regulator